MRLWVEAGPTLCVSFRFFIFLHQGRGGEEEKVGGTHGEDKFQRGKALTDGSGTDSEQRSVRRRWLGRWLGRSAPNDPDHGVTKKKELLPCSMRIEERVRDNKEMACGNGVAAE
jgi:hypothetical protein